MPLLQGRACGPPGAVRCPRDPSLPFIFQDPTFAAPLRHAAANTEAETISPPAVLPLPFPSLRSSRRLSFSQHGMCELMGRTAEQSY